VIASADWQLKEEFRAGEILTGFTRLTGFLATDCAENTDGNEAKNWSRFQKEGNGEDEGHRLNNKEATKGLATNGHSLTRKWQSEILQDP
jgi:hypothetical protein